MQGLRRESLAHILTVLTNKLLKRGAAGRTPHSSAQHLQQTVGRGGSKKKETSFRLILPILCHICRMKCFHVLLLVSLVPSPILARREAGRQSRGRKGRAGGDVSKLGPQGEARVGRNGIGNQQYYNSDNSN